MNVEQNKIIWLCKCDNKHGWLFIAFFFLPITLFADALEFDTVERANLKDYGLLGKWKCLRKIFGNIRELCYFKLVKKVMRKKISQNVKPFIF